MTSFLEAMAAFLGPFMASSSAQMKWYLNSNEIREVENWERVKVRNVIA